MHSYKYYKVNSILSALLCKHISVCKNTFISNINALHNIDLTKVQMTISFFFVCLHTTHVNTDVILFYFVHNYRYSVLFTVYFVFKYECGLET